MTAELVPHSNADLPWTIGSMNSLFACLFVCLGFGVWVAYLLETPTSQLREVRAKPPCEYMGTWNYQEILIFFERKERNSWFVHRPHLVHIPVPTKGHTALRSLVTTSPAARGDSDRPVSNVLPLLSFMRQSFSEYHGLYEQTLL